MLEFEDIINELKNLSKKIIIELKNEEDSILNDYIKGKLIETILKKCPFSSHLIRSVTQKDNNNNRVIDEKSMRHLLFMIVGGVNVFSTKRGEDITTECNEFKSFYNKLNDMVCNPKRETYINEEYLNNVCILSCLYHDIGKAIATEKHPSEGYQIIEGLGAVENIDTEYLTNKDELGADESEKNINNITKLDYFKNWLTKPLNKNDNNNHDNNEKFIQEKEYIFRFFTKLLRYHDIWGNITTGEASIVNLASTLDITESIPEIHLVFLGHLLLLNIADQYATESFFDEVKKIPQHINNDLLKKVIKKYNEVSEIISETKGDKESIKISLMEIAERERSTVDRICYLLYESGIKVESPKVNDILRSVCGGKYATFCRTFGAVRLCYALRFFKQIAKLSREEKLSPEKQCYNIVKILNRIVITYESLINTNKNQGIITGIEMSWLTRNEDISESIVKSLIKRSPNILSWIDDEISAFPCG